MTVDWSAVFGFSVSPLELIVRGTVMFWFIFLLFRVVVRRDMGSVGIADILIIVIIADASQNALAGEYTSVPDGMVLLATLIGWNYLLNWLSFHSRALDRLLEPPPLTLIRHGRVIRANLRRELITDRELEAKLRENGVESISEVKSMTMEADGQISLIRYGK
ncbi:DUF421 domain-containing protein [Imbroritus primus]|jgi:uncharacterized membrane protein YcaP (DUF421 family)|uniref:DUF421 domain-containing protein n=1 Tax=Imbroritus primus TaxID=3058603 RepID=A0ACD3SNP7_9BURK|nr:DUF421 domain-containing protein [Burkholderiaceae bacterium PBA]